MVRTSRIGWPKRVRRGKAWRRCPKDGPRSSIAASMRRAAPRTIVSSGGSSRSSPPSGCRRWCRRSKRSPRSPTTTRCAASGTRCGNSGRPSPATSRSMRTSRPGSRPRHRNSKRKSRPSGTRRVSSRPPVCIGHDGSGYPDGLAGEEIPLVARIVACCDAYNAMTTDRSYRKAMPRKEAVAELRRSSGTQFDPDVVEALISASATLKLNPNTSSSAVAA